MAAPVFLALILGGIVVLLFGGDLLVRGGAALRGYGVCRRFWSG